MPPSKIMAATAGLLGLSGRVKGDQSLLAPITNRPSLFWRVKVEKFIEGTDESSGTWMQADLKESAVTDFTVEDETGSALVLPEGATFIFSAEHPNCLDTDRDVLPDAGREYVTGLGYKWDYRADFTMMADPLRKPDTLRVREERLEPGSPVYVLGTVSNGREVFSLNDPLTPPRQDVPPKVVWKGRQHDPFIISDSEKSVLEDAASRMLSIIVGVVMACVGLYMLLSALMWALD